MRVGIVGNGADKFTEDGEHRARVMIRSILLSRDILVSGHSPLGGIDVWAEEEAAAMGIPMDIKVPEVLQWNPPGGYGYKARNLDIADSYIVHCIVADRYPDYYKGKRWGVCYHDNRTDHVKSGGCWTMKKAREKGNLGALHIVRNY